MATRNQAGSAKDIAIVRSRNIGFAKIPDWENLFVHSKQHLLINDYVDDFKVACRGPLQHVWNALKEADLDIDEPVEYQTYLGCAQRPIPLNEATL